ncbi:MAG: alpha/beta hydrolase [Spirochaetales bacterium]|nr:alpha/beta hydrolase [Spirochaetales bacterium]
MEDYSFIADDNVKIYAAIWKIEKPKAIVQIVHGMAEHIERYNDFALFLNTKGFIVAGEDHRGHGKTAGNLNNVGYFADEDGWNKVVTDNVNLGKKLREDYKDLPFYLFSHSMGSFLSRKLIAEYPEGIDKVILSGSGDFSKAQHFALNLVAHIQKTFIGGHATAKMLDKLAFSSMNNQFKPGKTGFEWLSRDEAKVEEYTADTFCGFVATIQFYIDFASGIKYLIQDEHLEKTPKDLPILFLSGSEDPVGGNKKLITGVYNKYLNTGHEKAELIFNEGGRHENLNEINRLEIYNIIYDWFAQ